MHPGGGCVVGLRFTAPAPDAPAIQEEKLNAILDEKRRLEVLRLSE